jgi:hypothetical protein
MGLKKDDRCLAKAYDDEMLFVLMARDATAPEVVVEWIKQSIRTQPREKLMEALECALCMVNSNKPIRGRIERDKKLQPLNDKLAKRAKTFRGMVANSSFKK